MSWRWLIWTLFSPSQVILVLLIAGGALLALGRERWGRRLSILGASLLVVFGLLPTSHFLMHTLEARFPQPDLPEQITGIVLLSGAERPTATVDSGEPQLNSAAGRYTTALRLAARYPDARLVFTGGPFKDPRTGELGQTGVGREILTSVGLDPSRLTFEEGSRDTCDNAFNAMALVKPSKGDRWVVVTSASHMPRTVACFRSAGWDVIPQPADHHSATSGLDVGNFKISDNLAMLDVALHEWVGLAYYRLSGRTREIFPAPRI
jgi:uncharacterized SAM-binding protein YcdF (DUF218 family)